MSRLARRWAREDGDVVGSTDPVADTGVGVEPELAETENEIAEGVVAGDEIEAATDELVEVNDIVEDAVVEDTPLSETDAQLVDIATESIRRRLNLGKASRVIAIEDFRGKAGRSSATRFASEGIGEMLKNAWEAVKKFFSQLWDRLVNFFKSMFDANLKLKNRAEAMLKKINEMKDDSEAKGDLKDSSVAKAFAVGGAFKAENINKVLAAHQTLLGHIKGNISNAKSVANSLKGDNAADKVNEFAGAQKGVFKGGHGDKIKEAFGEDVFEQGSSDVLVDGVVIGFVTSEIEVDDSKGNGRKYVKLSFVRAELEKDDVSEDLEESKKQEYVAIIKEVITLAKNLEAVAKGKADLDNLNKAFGSAFDKMAKATPKEGGAAEVKVESIMRHFVTESIKYEGKKYNSAKTMAHAIAEDVAKGEGISKAAAFTEIEKYLDKKYKKAFTDEKVTAISTSQLQEMFDDIKDGVLSNIDRENTKASQDATAAAYDKYNDDDGGDRLVGGAAGGKSIDSGAANETQAEVKSVSSLGKFLAESTSTIVKLSLTAGNQALNYVAKGMTKMKSNK